MHPHVATAATLPAQTLGRRAARTGTKTVVCIEDDVEVLDLVATILHDPNVSLVEACGGREGLEVLRTHKPDLILVDLFMPDVSGWEICRQIRADERLRDTPVVIVSAFPPPIASAVCGALPEVQGYICKPFSLAQFRSTVDRALGFGS